MSMFEQVRAALAGTYHVDRELARGGVARIFAATAPDGTAVAIKVLDPHVSLRIAHERFLREIELGSHLHHPHIVRILATGTVDDVPYYVMPLVEGGSLRERLSLCQRLSLPEAVRTIHQVADALTYAHAHDVMHRDIKPENIICGEHGAMVVDFGFARALSVAKAKRITQAGEVLGTPQYMSPEQALGKRSIDERADVYALGCVLYETLAGEPPFYNCHPDAVIVRRLRDTVPLIREVRPEVPESIQTLLIEALEWNVERRLVSAAAFRDRLALSMGSADDGPTDPPTD